MVCMQEAEHLDIRFVTDDDVAAVIEAAATAACHELDAVFPGQDAGGISGAFVAVLQEAIREMLAGRSLLDDVRGHAVPLARLALDDPFAAGPVPGDAFLVALPGDQVLCPGTTAAMPITLAEGAWSTFQAAAAAGRDFIRNTANGLWAASQAPYRIIAVVPLDGCDRGYRVADSAAAAA